MPVKLGRRVSKEEREQTILRVVRMLARRGYRFSTYRNLANAVFDEELFNDDIYIGWSQSRIRETLLKYEDEVKRIFREEGIGVRCG